MSLDALTFFMFTLFVCLVLLVTHYGMFRSIDQIEFRPIMKVCQDDGAETKLRRTRRLCIAFAILTAAAMLFSVRYKLNKDREYAQLETQLSHYIEENLALENELYAVSTENENYRLLISEYESSVVDKEEVRLSENLAQHTSDEPKPKPAPGYTEEERLLAIDPPRPTPQPDEKSAM